MEQREKGWLAVLLTAVAGYVDGVGFILLAQVYVANMSGNSIALGLGWAQGDVPLMVHRGAAIPAFLVGMVLSRVLLKGAERRGTGWMHGALFAAEALLIVFFIALASSLSTSVLEGRVGYAGLSAVLVLAFAMGVQNGALSRFGPISMRTTHVSGTLASLADEVSGALVGDPEDRAPARRRALVLFAAWAAYVVAAGLGIWLLGTYSVRALLLPVGALLALALASLLGRDV
ncbi:MAG: DUF1275 domain-containing protein [Armatimonadetes bacterium]|nr:DUF1275 domain-containing protein [Armatimonadota bacterium]